MANFEEFIKSKRVTKNSDFTHTSFKGGKYYIQSTNMKNIFSYIKKTMVHPLVW